MASDIYTAISITVEIMEKLVLNSLRNKPRGDY